MAEDDKKDNALAVDNTVNNEPNGNYRNGRSSSFLLRMIQFSAMTQSIDPPSPANPPSLISRLEGDVKGAFDYVTSKKTWQSAGTFVLKEANAAIATGESIVANVEAAFDTLHLNSFWDLKHNVPKDAATPAGRCAEGVRLACVAGGINMDILSDAYKYKDYLDDPKHGFKPVAEGSGLTRGDNLSNLVDSSHIYVCVWDRTAEHPSGHMAMWDGKRHQWTSDFTQVDMAGGSGFRAGDSWHLYVYDRHAPTANHDRGNDKVATDNHSSNKQSHLPTPISSKPIA